MTRAVRNSWNGAHHLFGMVRLGFARAGAAERHWKVRLELLRALHRTDAALSARLCALAGVAEAHGRPDLLAKVGTNRKTRA